MFRKLIATRPDAGALIARVTLGLIMLPHGAQHALGWFGGYGFNGTLGWMTKTLGFPAPLAALAIVVELVAPFALVFGLVGRLGALGISGLMLGALSTHTANGFFMNWFGSLPAGSEGFEYHLLALSLAAVVIINGSGAFSLDRGFVPTTTLPRRLLPDRREQVRSRNPAAFVQDSGGNPTELSTSSKS